MFTNYFLTAWRNPVRNKAFTTINILGLSLGMACTLLILLWVADERGVDGFHKNGKTLYQVYERNYFDGKVVADVPTQALLAGELARQIPEITAASSLEWNETNTFEANGKINKAEGGFANNDFFSMFSYPLLQGNSRMALPGLLDIAISRHMADMFFGTPANAIGKQIRFENETNYNISAVFENLPANASMHFDFLRSWPAFEKENSSWIQNWGNTDPQTFIQLKEGADSKKVEAKIKDFIYRFKQKSTSFKTELALIPFHDKYLHSTFKDGYPDGGRIEYVRLFSVVAIFIILIACINFMNLATARAAKRAKEVGVRKVIGAPRTALIMQFLGEALLVTFFSVALALVIATLLLPAFNSLSAKQLEMPWSTPIFWVAIVGAGAITGLVAGSYPALFLSGLLPITILKGNFRFGWKSGLMRKALVVFQFTLSIVLIVGMIVIYQQVRYIQSVNIGYDRDNLVYIPIEGELSTKYSLFKSSAVRSSAIRSVSKIRRTPTDINNHTGDVSWIGKDPNLMASFVNSNVGYDFVQTMNLQLLEGRDFSKDYGADSTNFLINETALKKIGYKDPIGKTLMWGKHSGKIVGVLRDFHFASLHQSIEPIIFRLEEGRPSGTILVKLQKGKTREGLAAIQKICETINPKFPFSYQFSDEEFNKLYKSEQVISKLSNLFAVLAIFISCLGLFGLATFSAEQRTKEIGVRKVLGASVPNIVRLLTGNFLKPVFVALALGFPLAWFAMHHWLDNFAYKTEFSWWIFAFAGLLTLSIAILTVSFQCIRAAVANPVSSLRNE